jgi:ABC-type multidrug transport system fused ATPase/permease subunit
MTDSEENDLSTTTKDSSKTGIKLIVIAVSIVFVVLIVLVLVGLISILTLVFGFIVLIILGSIIAGIIILVKRGKKNAEEKQGEIIAVEVAKRLANEVQYYPEVFDYFNKVTLESPAEYFGSPGKKIPVYIKVGETLYERKILGVLINRITGEAFWEKYDELEVSKDRIIERLRIKANLLAKEPSPEQDTEREVVIGPQGERIERERRFSREESESPKKSEGFE